MSLAIKRIFAAVIGVMWATSCAHASLAYRVEQSKVRVPISAGSSYSGVIRIYSQSNDPIRIKVYMEDWSYTSEQDGSKNFYPAQTKPYSCANWIKYNPNEFILASYGVQTVNYVVSVPPDAKGGYYCVMFFEAEASQEELLASGGTVNLARTDIGIALRLGSLFYIDVKNTVTRQAAFSNFSVSKGLKNEYSIDFDLTNTGNGDITADGNFYIMDGQGMIFGRGEFAAVYTFPGDTAPFSAQWKAQMPEGTYDMIMTMNLGKGFENEKDRKRGPIVTKESRIVIDDNGEVTKVGPLK